MFPFELVLLIVLKEKEKKMADIGEVEELKKQREELEAALKEDPENEELLKMKEEVEELVKLAEEVEQLEEAKGGEEQVGGEKVRELNGIKVGEKVMALWEVDKVYYKAVVDSITEDNTKFAVTFLGYGLFSSKNIFFLVLTSKKGIRS